MARKANGNQTGGAASPDGPRGPDASPLHIAVVDGDERTAVNLGESAKFLGRCWSWQSYVNGSRPDAVLMDIQTLQQDNLVSLREIKAALPAVSLIVRAKFLDLDDLSQLVVAGVSGFLLRPTTPEVLVRTIEDVLRHGVGLCPEIQGALFAHLRGRAVDNRCQELTWQERKIMHLLAERHSNPEISTKLGVSPATIHAHLAHIYKKLGVHSREEARRRIVGLD